MEQADRKRNHMQKYLNLECYSKMKDDIKAQLHRTWRKDPTITTLDVQKALGLTSTTKYYEELDRLGVEYQKKSGYKRRKKKAASQPTKLESSCAITFNGIYDPQSLVNQIEALGHMIDLTARGYEFTITLNKIIEE